MLEIIKKLFKIKTDSWTDYLAEPEIQKYQTFDTMSCTTQAVLNSLEAQFNYLLENKKLNKEWLQEKGYIKNGKVQFSKRYIAKLSGTTHKGNWIRKVNEAVLKYGLVPEILYDYKHADAWNEYYKKIEPTLKEIGEEFLKHFDIAVSWKLKQDFKDFEEELKKSPGAVVVYAWRKRNGVYYKPNNKTTNHAVSLIDLKEDNYIIKDSYSPFVKEVNQFIGAGYFYKIFMKQEDLTKWLLDNDLKTIRNSETGEIGYCVHGVLATLPTIEERLNALMDMRNRGLTEAGVNINNLLWKKIPKKRFKDIE